MKIVDYFKSKLRKLTKSDIKVIILTLIVCIAMLTPSTYIRNNVIHGRVIQEVQNKNNKNKQLSTNKVKVKVLNGDLKGKIVTVDNIVNDKTYHRSSAHKGSKVLLNIDLDNNKNIKKVYIYEIVRYKYLLGLTLVFLLLLVLLGGMQGVRSVLGLLITAFALLKLLLPLILKGFDPILSSVIICIGISILNLLVISGKNKKTLSAIIGTLGGTLIAGIIALGSSYILQIIGYGEEEAQMIIYMTQNPKFNFKGLLFAAILMGALGAVMDVAMSIASSMNEVKVNNPNITKVQLIKAGFNVGKDVMGTMANTLILAYAGGSMYTLLLMLSYNLPFERMLNQDVMAAQIIQSLCGSIGLICTIPITTLAVGIIGTNDEVEGQFLKKIKEKDIDCINNK